MKQITLSQNKVVLVDDEDYEEINKYHWYARKDLHTYYAQRKEKQDNGKWKIVLMHRVIAKVPDGLLTDHIDKNGLNNQKNNLRIVTHQQNMMNMRKRKDNTSGITGIYWRKRDKSWLVCMNYMNKTISGGQHKNKEDAIKSLQKLKKMIEYPTFGL